MATLMTLLLLSLHMAKEHDRIDSYEVCVKCGDNCEEILPPFRPLSIFSNQLNGNLHNKA
jgi:hypothetical protein